MGGSKPQRRIHSPHPHQNNSNFQAPSGRGRAGVQFPRPVRWPAWGSDSAANWMDRMGSPSEADRDRIPPPLSDLQRNIVSKPCGRPVLRGTVSVCNKGEPVGQGKWGSVSAGPKSEAGTPSPVLEPFSLFSPFHLFGLLPRSDLPPPGDLGSAQKGEKGEKDEKR